ncbi:DNA-binding protein [Paenibacillus sp. PL2-23]|uniref:DNA-binding protein n=1 Tax=Paenibacillus sp. PL2-23 TaxID=2100729 RepID=UPI0030FA054A
MFKVEIDTEQIQRLINESVAKAIEKHSFARSLPPVLTRSQLMEFLDIGSTKAAELLNRADFPVVRELGHPRILTHQLIQWMERHSDWVNDNAPDHKFSRLGA